MKRCLLVVMAGLMILGSGCETLSDVVGSVNLEVKDVAPFVRSGAKNGVNSGLKALSKDAASFEKTKTVAAEVEVLINDSVLPLFQGDAVESVTLATANQAMEALNKANIDPQILGAIQLAIDSSLLFIKMPENPTDELSEDTKNLVIALFDGMAEGLAKFQSWGGPDSGARDLAAPVLECSWSKGGVKP
ncbi:MAG: hypothetical protein ACYTBS_23470 [Planctomycetota bacterium]|jgi:hypothetical protein